ncbi:glycosyltransferase family 4 protein [Salisediminibacterium halotolerans]|uniref:Galacturonosyltransferase n=1 Tax=Salisediminibacterium halotolerans TaxID=517425 RepID=A0A1H9QIC7_9BACI|nr:glycosyltransferase family 4 protein [Salisediminibacterium haloalkalitolerans]SER60180.1 galacturonosyltransferase [Salisediminibacterium haloalkalitolerans]
MNVLILTNSLIGVYNFRLEFVQRLTADGDTVTVAAPEDADPAALQTIGARFAATPFQLHGKNPAADIRLMRTYRRLINETNADIVYTYTIKPNIYGGLAAQSARVPYVATITGLGTAVAAKGPMQTLTVNLYRRALKHAQTVYFQNTENRDFFMKNRIIDQRIRLTAGSGVNTEHFAALPYPADASVTRFLFLGRVMEEKGIRQYLEAAKTITARHPETEFHVVGGGETAERIALKRFETAGVITYHGETDDIRPYLETAHCTVHPTMYPEGMSNVLLESAASARPLIATDRAGCREIIDAETTGYLVTPADSESLSAAIEQFLALSRAEQTAMGRAGRAKVVREFDRRAVVEQYAAERSEVYEPAAVPAEKLRVGR